MSCSDDMTPEWAIVCLVACIIFFTWMCCTQQSEEAAAQVEAKRIGGSVDREYTGSSFHYFARDAHGKRLDLK